MDTVKDLIKRFRGQLIFTFVAAVMILVMPFEDYIERTFDYEDMNYSEDLLGIIKDDGGVLTVPDGYGEVTLYSNSIYLPAGTYTVSFSIDTGEDDCHVFVYADEYLNDDNTSGLMLTDGVITTGSESVNLEFTVEGGMTSIQFRAVSSGYMLFRGIYILSGKNLYSDPYIYAGLLIFSSAVLLTVRMRKRVGVQVLILLAAAAVWATLPMSFSFLFYGHDLPYHYARLYCLSEDLFSGQLPVMIHSQMYSGFGYMIPVFYSEVFLVPFAILIHFGLSPIGGYKLLILCINLATAGVGYYSFSRLMGSRKLGMVTAFFYTMASYRLINLYTRSAVGEVLAAVFLPLLILGIAQIFYGNHRKWFTAAIAFTAIFQSHMISTEICLGFCILTAFIAIRQFKDKCRILSLIRAAAATILLNIWSIVPIIDLMQYPLSVFTDSRVLTGYAAYPLQLLDTALQNAAGEALPTSSVSGEMPYSIGLALVLGCLLFIAVCMRKGGRLPHMHRKIGIICFIYGGLSLYASSTLFPWESLQRIDFIDSLVNGLQFAYRFLTFSTVFLCVPAALGVYYFFRDRQLKSLLFLITAILMMYTSGVYFSSYVDESDIYTQWNEQSDYTRAADTLYLITYNFEYFHYKSIVGQDVVFISSDNLNVSDVYRDGTDAGFTYEITAQGTDEAYVDVPFLYYPYYKAYDGDGNELETSVESELLRLRVTLDDASSSGTVTISFEIPWYCRAAEGISIVSAVCIAAYSIASKAEHKKRISGKWRTTLSPSIRLK